MNLIVFNSSQKNYWLFRYDLRDPAGTEGTLPSTVAVKKLKSKTTTRASFEKIISKGVYLDPFPFASSQDRSEERIQKCLRHENVVRLFGWFTADGGDDGSTLCLVMEYCPASLEDLLRRRRPTLAEVGLIMQGLHKGLAYLHGKGYIHRYLAF